MTKIHSFLYVIHKANEKIKTQAEDWCKKQEHKWYTIALEPYMQQDDNRGGTHHLHLMFRAKNQRYPAAVTKQLMQIFDKPREDIWQEPIQGRFKDQVNYVTNEYAGEHKDSPKVLDPQPIIYPLDTDPDDMKKKVCVKSEIIRMLNEGKGYKDILRAFPEWCLTNGGRLKQFIKEYKPIAQEIQRENYYKARQNGKVQENLLDLI